jgi:UDP-N-acetylmuramyl pentapeptide phosphotransferase/UDP-N-acetylglucosamine-1-phosphate transferase
MWNISIGIIVLAVSMIVSLIAYKILFRYARAHDIVDKPSVRKVQHTSVPVMGGEAVFAGMLAGVMLLRLLTDSYMPTCVIIGMAVMMIVGLWDDVRELSVTLRFVIEIVFVGLFIAVTGVYIDNFYGLWSVYELSPWVGVPLSIFIGVGIINAVNLIDGVDGYSSGYVMFTCVIFGVAFWKVWDPAMFCFILIVLGALIPFFMYNVFGKKTKMFLGDGGSLMLGALMAVLVFYAMSSKQKFELLADNGVGVGALTLAVTCIPVFDTLRVMSLRMSRGKSPFSPDKTHLHHLFLEMGFSHLGTVLSILLLNTMVVLLWYLSYLLGASVDVQMYLVILLGFAVTFGFYTFMKMQKTGKTTIWRAMCRLGARTCQEKNCVWRFFVYMMDESILRKNKMES